MPKAGREWVRRWGPEAALAILAAVVFLGCLGSIDLWGKREQRASAEAIDTIGRGHWLVAEIQGRKRLEKPPLPRWTTAALIRLTGRSDETIVRLPSALSALGMVALVYALGRRMAGCSAGLAAGLALTSFAFFFVETRQAGNDGPLAFFTTLALYCAWRRLHGGPIDAQAEEGGQPDAAPGPLGARGWAVGMYAALGLGFLCKGPVVALIVALTVVPYLLTARRLREGLRALVDWRGLVLFVALALSWPVPVLINDPNAARVWYLEMAQKAGTAGIAHHQQRTLLVVEWLWMTAPWTALAVAALILPLRRRSREECRPWIWFPWWWAVGSLAMFCLWTVAKPNYYLPCVPGVALLVGVEWVRLTRLARGLDRRSAGARRILQVHWVLLFVAALAAPAVVAQAAPELLGPVALIAMALAAAVVTSAWAWRRGANALALAPLVGAMAVAVLIGYGRIAPAQNAARSHRELAARLDHVLPSGARTVMFYRELDEGLWFYLRDRGLAPVPNSQPAYNRGLELLDEFKRRAYDPDFYDDDKRLKKEAQVLIDWLGRPRRESEYVLIRAKVYQRLISPALFGPGLGGRATPMLSEQDLKRNELVLLHVPACGQVAEGPRDRR
jgi:4-amino-4-deoxy-L-arabinose transferase-like glycosyltransferase